MLGHCHGINALINSFVLYQRVGSNMQQSKQAAWKGAEPQAADLALTGPTQSLCSSLAL